MEEQHLSKRNRTIEYVDLVDDAAAPGPSGVKHDDVDDDDERTITVDMRQNVPMFDDAQSKAKDEELHKVNDELHKVNDELHKVNDELRKVNDELCKVKDELHKANMRVRKAKDDRRKAHININIFKEAASIAKLKQDSAIADVKKVRNDFNGVMASWDESLNELSQVKVELSQARIELSLVKDELNKVKDELDKVKDELDKVKDELNKVKAAYESDVDMIMTMMESMPPDCAIKRISAIMNNPFALAANILQFDNVREAIKADKKTKRRVLLMIHPDKTSHHSLLTRSLAARATAYITAD